MNFNCLLSESLCDMSTQNFDVQRLLQMNFCSVEIPVLLLFIEIDPVGFFRSCLEQILDFILVLFLRSRVCCLHFIGRCIGLLFLLHFYFLIIITPVASWSLISLNGSENLSSWGAFPLRYWSITAPWDYYTYYTFCWNMIHLIHSLQNYNRELEYIAQCWVNSCHGSPLKHDLCRRTSKTNI